MKLFGPVIVAAGFVIGFPLQPSWAQSKDGAPSYTQDEIIRYFSRNLGNPRSICIGTQTDCAAAPVPTPDDKGFDLLVTFNYDSDALTKAAKSNLDEFATALRSEQLRLASFLVEGHTDAKGSESYNLGLSTRRAQAVVAYLGVRGIDLTRLHAKGYGKLHPRTGNPFDGENRRVEARMNVASNAQAKP